MLWTMIAKWAAAGYLIPAVIWDIRKRAVPVRFIRLALLIALVLRFLAEGGFAEALREDGVQGMVWKFASLFAAALPGIILLFLGYVTGEAVGYADGWSVLLLGLFAGSGAAVCVLMTAFFFSAVYALWLIVGQRAKPGMRFPFLPHISAGYLVWIMFSSLG